MNKYAYILIGLLVLLIAAFVWFYYQGKKSGDQPKPINLPNNGSGIPAGWSAFVDAQTLHDAISGFGTDEETIFFVLQRLTADQLAAVYNEYLNQFGVTLTGDLSGDLSGEDLTRALSYFNGII